MALQEFTNLNDVIADLQREVLGMMPDHIRDLRSALMLAPTDQGARAALQRLGHRLRGTAATVYLEAIGDLGRAIERFSIARAQWTSHDVARVSAAIDALSTWTTRTLASERVEQDTLRDDPRVKALMEAP